MAGDGKDFDRKAFDQVKQEEVKEEIITEDEVKSEHEDDDRKDYDRKDFDKNVNTFTPDGRVLQVEYATEASKMGPTSIGICIQKAVVLVAEKRRTSSLMLANALDPIMKVDNHIACTVAGMMADARTLIFSARMECSKHAFNYNESIPIEALMHFVGHLAMQFGKGGNATDAVSTSSESDGADELTLPKVTSRPYGSAFLFGGMDLGQPHLWHLDPTGEFKRFEVEAIGSGADAAYPKLAEHYAFNMPLKAAKFLAITALEEAVGEKLTPNNLEMMIVTPTELCHLLTKEELQRELASRDNEPMETST